MNADPEGGVGGTRRTARIRRAPCNPPSPFLWKGGRGTKASSFPYLLGLAGSIGAKHKHGHKNTLCVSLATFSLGP